MLSRGHGPVTRPTNPPPGGQSLLATAGVRAMSLARSKTRPVFVKNVQIGGGAPISVQTMTKTDTRNVEATLGQLRDLHHVGVDIVRLACPDERAAAAFGPIMREAPVPIIADIHFDYRLANMVLDNG